MTSCPRTVVIGSGGHAKVVLDILLDRGDVDLAGCVSADAEGPSLLGVPILGGDEVLPGLLADGVTHALVAIGDNRVRA